jgi:hypothetical protein
MTGVRRFFIENLGNVHTREEMALVWRVCREVQKHFGGLDWKAVTQAFKQRCGELGIEWKGE